jgi:hypothetical protein
MPKRNGQRLVHYAIMITWNGEQVSPLCSDRPKPINMVRDTWTINPVAVTCKKCARRLKRMANKV